MNEKNGATLWREVKFQVFLTCRNAVGFEV